MARHLLERETAGVTDAPALGAAMQRACTRVAESLRSSLGDDGYSALLTRAFESAESGLPVLSDIRRVEADGVDLDVVGGVEGHGAVAVGAALQALFTAIVDILSDLIGADMVRALLDENDGPHMRSGRRTQ
jgi:hypothetical protein